MSKQPTPPPKNARKPKAPPPPPPSPGVLINGSLGKVRKDLENSLYTYTWACIPSQPPEDTTKPCACKTTKPVNKVACSDCKFYEYIPLFHHYCNHLSNLDTVFDPLYGERQKYIKNDCTDKNTEGYCIDFKPRLAIRFKAILKKFY